MKTKCFLIIIISIILLTGCTALTPYIKPKYGEMAIDNWFNSETLGVYRKDAEKIDEIVSKKCTYIENKNNKYVFKCTITYKEKGETVIPLSKNSTLDVYAVFIKEKRKTYSSKVYNSKYTKESYKVWEKDTYLNY